jgi:RNA polymerase sigma-70 factor (ECF subfamily)
MGMAKTHDGNGTQGGGHVLTTREVAEFTALVQRQSRFVFRVAYAVLLNAHDAEDAVQETFLKLYRNGGWQQAENERAFLARVGWRVAVDRRRTANPAASGDSEMQFDPASSQPGPEQALVAANQHAVIHAMIDALPEELRLPLVLSATDELNSREIAEILRIPEGTVRTRLQRARQVLRWKLANLNTRNQETQHA